MARHSPAVLMDGDDPIEPLARLIAEGFHADLDQTRGAIKRLLEDLPFVRMLPDNWPASERAGYAGEFLRAAYRTLGWKEALEFLSTTPLDALEERVWVTRCLAGADDRDGLPLFSRQELREQLRSFREFLLADRQHLLQTGLPSKEFQGSRWLWSIAAKLYVTKRTEFGGPYDKPRCFAGELSYYRWVRVTQDPDQFVVQRVPCRQENADLITGIRAADADRLQDLREKILDLKVDLLAVFEQFLASAPTDGLSGKCLAIICDALTPPEIEFCMRMDRAYKEIPVGWTNIHPILWGGAGYDGPNNPGGLNSTLNLIGHVEKEHMIGTMHMTREALGDLVVNEDGRRLIAAGDAEWSYFEFVDRPNIERLDRAIDIFRDCDACEAAFWGEFHERVSAMVAGELKQEVTVHLEVGPDVAEPLPLTVQNFGDGAKSHFGASGRLPMLELAQPGVAQLSKEKGDNFFRRRGDNWEIRFKGGPSDLFLKQDGLLYLSVLVECLGEGFSAAELYALKNQHERSSKSQSAAIISEFFAEHSEDGERDRSSAPNLVSNAGPVFDRKARKECGERLAEIEEELNDADKCHDKARKGRLLEEKEAIVDKLRTSTGLWGRLVQQSPEAKNYRDKVRNAIERAITAIDKQNKPLAQHFRSAVEFSPLFKYSPEEPIVWNH